MKLTGRCEFRGREERPDWKEPAKSNYYISLEDGIKSDEYYVRKEIYDLFAFKKGQILDVQFCYTPGAKFFQMQLVDAKPIS